MRVFVDIYGCAAAQAEGEMIRGLLVERGYKLVSRPEEADAIVLVTCIVKKPTEDRMKNLIKRYYSLVGERLIVYGCMATAERYIIEKLAPKASIVGNYFLTKIPEVLEKASQGIKTKIIGAGVNEIHLGLPRVPLDPLIGTVEVSHGCLGICSYCIVRFARGLHKPFPPDMIVEEVKRLLARGAIEIRLTGQDLTPYKYNNERLPDLLRRISEIPGRFRVRIGMMNPRGLLEFLDDLLDVVYSDRRFYRFFHIPVQSGSNRILKLMRRFYEAEEFVEIVRKIRSRDPLATIATDIIVGFPTETDEDFELTLELIKKTQPDVVNISHYGDRPGTLAAKMPKVPREKVYERSRRLHELTEKIAFERAKLLIGLEDEVPIMRDDKRFPMGRTFNYKPVYLDSGSRGQRARVKYYSTRRYAILGKTLELLSRFTDLFSSLLAYPGYRVDIARFARL